jgi:hypothetical protein
MPKRKYMPLVPGQPFGRLEVVRLSARRTGCVAWYWVRCRCGVEKEVRIYNLLKGKTQSCGCLNRERSSAAHTTHGATRHGARPTEYGIWSAMLKRCHCPTNKKYNLYGGRGITVCDRWRHDFAAFLADMGPRPSGKHSIERADNSKGYDPGNCRWATQAEQMRNTRCTRNITYNGRTMCLKDWAAEVGIHHRSLAYRLNRGWPLETALSAPPRGDHQVPT